jgi:hypothetical protein
MADDGVEIAEDVTRGGAEDPDALGDEPGISRLVA